MKIKAHLRICWYYYLLIALVALFLWTTVYDILAQPASNEKITITFFGDNYSGEQMQQDLQNNIGNITTQDIQKVAFEQITAQDNAALGSVMMTSSYSSDIFIFEQGSVDEATYANFLPLTESLLAYFDGIDPNQLYKIDGVAYGFVLTGEQIPSNNFSQYYTGGKQCIAFCVPLSVNFGGVYGQGNATDDAAIYVLKYLLENTNG